jgi:DNA-binding Lrp family transcriptional regulator
MVSAQFIRQIEGVKEAFAVSQHCDIMAVVEAEDFNSLYRFVMHRIKVIRGVRGARILPCLDLEIQPSETDPAKLPGV